MPRKKVNLYQCFLIILLWIFVCSQSGGASEAFVQTPEVGGPLPTRPNISQNPAIKIHPKYNDIALLLAGIKINKDSDYNAFTLHPEWQKYAAMADAGWSRFTKNIASQVQGWAAKELTDIHRDVQTVFYPFSGPDFLYAFLFFPGARTYIFVGLEPVGTIPDPLKFSKEAFGPYLSLIFESIDKILQISFFRVKDLSAEVVTTGLNGTLPILMLFLARTGNEIVDIKPVEIASNGKIAILDRLSATKGPHEGVAISFRTKNSESVQQLYYFSEDLANFGLAKNAGFRQFLDGLEPGIFTFIKAASYLMHIRYFSMIRSTILNKSRVIVQEDSGIPFHFFDRSIWDIHLYGTYSEPIKKFKEYFDQDLKDAYAAGAPALNFRIGYSPQSNLLVARRKP
jgi:hypothetical protein